MSHEPADNSPDAPSAGRSYQASAAGTHPRTPDEPAGRQEGVFSDPDFRRPSEVTGATEESRVVRRPAGPPVPVRDVMTGRVEVAGPDDTLQAAAEKMRGLD